MKFMVVAILIIALILTTVLMYKQFKALTHVSPTLKLSCPYSMPCYNPFFNISTDSLNDMYIDPGETIEVKRK